MSLPFVKINNMATTPRRATLGSAGLDLTSCEDVVILAHGKALVSTGIAMSIPQGHYGRIAPRSGFSYRCHTDIGAGVIDSDYRGEVKVLIFNLSSESTEIRKGDKIAQIIIEKHAPLSPKLVTSLDNTVRGENGFGSSGR